MITPDPTMNKKKKTKTEPAKSYSHDIILGLPNYILVDIFSKIPTRKLLQFKTVSKSWLSLLSDPQFTKDLFAQTPSCFMMYSQCQLIPNGTFIVDPEKASSPDGVSLRVPNSANDDPYWMRHMVGSCNGILCIRYIGVENKKRSNFNNFYLLHPITGETVVLPRLKNAGNPHWCHRYCVYGFGFSPITHKYKLLVIIHPAPSSCEWKAMVLTVGSKSWRSIGSYKNPGSLKQEMVYLNGFLHCFDRNRYSIHAFDIESERFQEFQVPRHRPFDSHGLGVLGGCLSLAEFTWKDPDVSCVWVMKDYGIEESWTKEWFEMSRCGLRPLKFTEGKLFVAGFDPACGSSLMAHTPGTRSLQKIEVVGMPPRSCVYRLFVPNLVPLKDISSGA